jgi:hypothetical protein
MPICQDYELSHCLIGASIRDCFLELSTMSKFKYCRSISINSTNFASLQLGRGDNFFHNPRFQYESNTKINGLAKV